VFVLRYPPDRRERARELRRRGWSLNAIAGEVGIAKSTASLWVCDIPLTPDQVGRLYAMSDRQRAGNRARSRLALEARMDAQELGRMIARIDDPLHQAGCMLYWAEGSKSRNALAFVNSDVDMMRFFLRFMRLLDVPDDRIKLSVNVHLGNGLSVREIEEWWLEQLDLPPSCLRKATVNRTSSASKAVRKPLIHGTARITVNSTRLVQSIYGAIQEYAGIERPEWAA
jgi:transcriptional regulator with XRE-family HTH domain